MRVERISPTKKSANQRTTCVDSAVGVVRAEKAVGGGMRNSVSPAKKNTAEQRP